MTNRCPHCNRRLPRAYQFVPPSYGRETVFGVISFTAGYGMAFFALFHIAWPQSLWPWALPSDVIRLVAGAALFGIGLALEGIGVMTAFWLMERDEGTETMEATSPEFAATSRYTLRRLPAGVSQFRLWQYMGGIAVGRVTLSQDGAAEYGFDREQSNEIKEWLIAVGWYEWINASNASGRWTDEGGRVLNLLSRPEPALWDELTDAPVASRANG